MNSRAIYGFVADRLANHPFLDGNKRVGHASMEVMLVLNGYEISAEVDEQERVIISVASGTTSREHFAGWLEKRLTQRPT